MKIGIAEAFRKYGAKLKNVNWSVSAWTDSGELVVSLWEHHRVKNPPPGTLTFADSFERWSGAGNNEFRANVCRAYEIKAPVRLVIVLTLESEKVQNGDDASKIPKTFAVRNDLIGRVISADNNGYAIEFRKLAS